MELTDEVLNTQLYDKVDDYKALEYDKKNCRLEEYVEKDENHNITCSLVLKQLPLKTNTCHIYVGFTMKIHSRSL